MTYNNLKLIEDYIDGKLTGKDLVLFEKKLKSDNDLADEYRLRVDLEKLWKEADEYEQTKVNIASVLSKNKIRFYRSTSFYFLSVAASVIILAAIYFLLFQTNSAEEFNNNTYATTQDSTNTNDRTITFQYDEPDSFAQVDSVSQAIILLSPIDGETYNNFETITFTWTSSETNSDTLFIAESKSGNIVLKLNINLSDTALSIQYPQFSIGEYTWYISDTTQIGTFNITKNKE